MTAIADLTAIPRSKIKNLSADANARLFQNFLTSLLAGVQALPLASVAFAAPVAGTIATGSLTLTSPLMSVAGEGAANDDLTTLAGGVTGGVYVLYPVSDTVDITIKHGSVNIECMGQQDIVLAEDDDIAFVIKLASKYVVVAYKTKSLAGGGLGKALAAITTGLGASLIGIEDSGTLITATTVEAALAELATKIAALVAENTDGQVQIPLFSGAKDGGGWTPSITSGGLASITRTAAATADSWWADVPLPVRTTATKGRKPTGLVINYSVVTAVPDDVRFELWKVTQGADGSARTAAVLGGQSDVHYDSNHNTAAKRGAITGAPQLHKATVTIPTPAYLAAGESLKLRCFVDGDAGPTGVVVVTDAVLLFSETQNDIV